MSRRNARVARRRGAAQGTKDVDNRNADQAPRLSRPTDEVRLSGTLVPRKQWRCLSDNRTTGHRRWRSHAILQNGFELARFGADELGRIAVNALLTRTGLDPNRIDQVIFGCVGQPVDAAMSRA